MKLVILIGMGIAFGSFVNAEEVTTKVEKEVASSSVATNPFKEVIEKFEIENKAFQAKVRSETDSKKLNELYQNEAPDAQKAVTKIVEIAKVNPKADGVEDALIWALKHPRGRHVKAISDLLLNNYMDSKSTLILVRTYFRMGYQGEQGLRVVLKKTKDERVKQAATYYLGMRLLRTEEKKKEGLELMKQLLAWPGLEKANPHLFEAVKNEIFAVENLAVGSKVPDIQGVDEAGKEFKLSDYKGKVVLLDFWGFW